jgi:hypothetical protein
MCASTRYLRLLHPLVAEMGHARHRGEAWGCASSVGGSFQYSDHHAYIVDQQEESGDGETGYEHDEGHGSRCYGQDDELGSAGYHPRDGKDERSDDEQHVRGPPLSLSLSIHLYMHVSLYVCLSICLSFKHFPLSLSLFLSNSPCLTLSLFALAVSSLSLLLPCSLTNSRPFLPHRRAG